MKKIEQAEILFKANEGIFSCPLCRLQMHMNHEYALTCPGRHNFDLSRQGYINLLTRPVKSEYDKLMLEARLAICRDGSFNELSRQISGVILRHLDNNTTKQLFMLDAGCGEGSQLASVTEQLTTSRNLSTTAIGVDLSKDGIYIAAREYPGILWCVADLSRSPFADSSFDIILNLFSPSNYTEFNRLLKPGGILIKVIPGSDYLIELRQALYQGKEHEPYSNEDVVAHFYRNLDKTDCIPVRYRAPVKTESIPHLIQMTPLSWNASERDRQRAQNANLNTITIDTVILTGKPKTDT